MAFDPFQDPYLADPYPLFAQVRASAPALSEVESAFCVMLRR